MWPHPTFWNKLTGTQRMSVRHLAERWDKAITSALLRVIRNPAAGSPCRFRSPELNDVRRIAIRGFPKHLLFYRFCKQEVLVLRIVHGARDLERLL